MEERKEPGSVTRNLPLLKAGDKDAPKDAAKNAAHDLWEHFVRRLVRLAGQKIRGLPVGQADKHDVALSAFASFCQGIRDGRFDMVANENDLWRLLVGMVKRKAIDHRRHAGRARRGGGGGGGGDSGKGGGSRGDGGKGGGGDGGGGGLRHLPVHDLPPDESIKGNLILPTPDLEVALVEECQRLFDILGDDDLRQIVRWKVDGLTNVEIADKTGKGKTLRSVERNLKTIREIWREREEP